MSDKTNIIVFCGKKGAGKNLCSNFLHGYQMKAYGLIEDFGLLEDTGSLVVTTKALDENGKESSVTGEIDITREDMEFGEWAAYNMWPFIKNYSFAKELKDICVALFNIPKELVYGTDEQKNTLVEHLRWENMPGLRDEPKRQKWSGPMTAREFMQFFGTEVMRKIYSPVWIERTLKNIQTECPQIAVISDCRFKNEAETMKAVGAKLIYLTRSTYQDAHKSENAFEDFTDFDAVLDNADMSIEESQKALIKIIDSWGWLGDRLSKNNEGGKR